MEEYEEGDALPEAASAAPAGPGTIAGYRYDKYAYDPEVIDQFVAVMFQDKNFLSNFRVTVKPEYFESDDHRDIVTVLLEYFDKQQAVPGRAVFSQLVHNFEKAHSRTHTLGGYDPFITKLFTVDLGGSVDWLGAQIREFAQHQACKGAAANFIKSLPFPDKRADAVKIMEEATQVGKSAADHGIPAWDYEGYLKWKEGMERIRIPTGIWHIDSMTADAARGLAGGFARGTVNIYAAGTGTGKTTLAIITMKTANMAGWKSVFFTTEGSPDEIRQKYLCSVLNVDDKELASKPRDIRERMQAHADKLLERCFIKFLPPYEATLADVRATLGALSREKAFYPDLLVIDSPDFLKPLYTRSENLADKEGEIWNMCAGIAIEYNATIIGLTDIKQTALSEPLITLEHIGGGYTKRRRADSIIGMAQPTLDDKTAGIVHCSHLKGRANTAGGTFDLQFAYPKCAFIRGSY